MNFETIKNLNIRCHDCFEVMDAEKWLSHKCGNNYQVKSEPVITRAHLRTLARMAVQLDACSLCPVKNCVIDGDSADSDCENNLIECAIENPTDE